MPDTSSEPHMHHKIVLAARPQGRVRDEHFREEHAPIPSASDGEILVRTSMFSLDPYMRGRMNDGPSYAAPVAIGEVMTARGIGTVIESKCADFAAGDTVFGHTGWQSHCVMRPPAAYAPTAAAAMAPRALDSAYAPPSTALGILGMPGLTAYVGLQVIGAPAAGETVVVSAASGAVGAVVGQLARMRGCRVVGVAGAASKCDYVVEELGFDACVSHHSATLAEELRAACPDGIDIYFENVGGKTFEAVLPQLNTFARIPVCGSIANYNSSSAPSEVNYMAALQRAMTSKRLHMQGFIVSDRWDLFEEYHAQMSAWIRAGRAHYKEDIVDGLANAPRAFQGLLAGENFGKLLIRVS